MAAGMTGYEGSQPDLGFWHTALKEAKAFRYQRAFESQWDIWRAHMRGDYADGVMPVNLFFKMIRTLVPRVYFRNPRVVFSPTQPAPEYIALSLILERVVNILLTEMRIKYQLKAMVYNTFMFGTGIGKLGLDTEYNPIIQAISSPAVIRNRTQTVRLEYNSRINENSPWFLSVHPGEFLVPAYTRSLDSSRWYAHQICRDRDDVMADPRYKNQHKIGKQNPNTMARRSADIERRINGQNEDDVILYEIYDKKTGRIFVVDENTQVVLLDEVSPALVNKQLNVFPLIFNPDDLYFWGLPDARVLDPQQREANETRTAIMRHRRMTAARLLAKKNAVLIEEAAKIRDGLGDPFIWLEANASMNDVKDIGSLDIPRGLQLSMGLIQQDVQEYLGLGANQFGEYAPGSAERSATEANIVHSATQIRIDERRDITADTLVNIVEQIIRVLFATWSGEKIVDLVGPHGQSIWVQFATGAFKESDYSVIIDPDSSLPETRAVKFARAQQMYALLSKNPLIDPQLLTNYLVRASGDLALEATIMQPPEANQLAGILQQQNGGGGPINVNQLTALLPFFTNQR